MSAHPVICSVEQGVATVTLNRPERKNAWTTEMEHQYVEILVDLESRPDVAAAVVTGQGTSFCPGLDAEQLALAGGGSFVLEDHRSMLGVLGLGLPLVCAINGACAGVGLLQALACDVRFAASTAKLTTAFARRGTVAELATAWLLPRIVGHANALDLLLSGRVVDGDEAAALGLVNRACEPDRLLDEAHAYARELAVRCAPGAMAAIKRQVYDDWSRTIADAEATARCLLADPGHQADFAEGAASFVERRAPAFAPFTGRGRLEAAAPRSRT